MDDKTAAKYWALKGMPFQFGMMTAFTIRSFLIYKPALAQIPYAVEGFAITLAHVASMLIFLYMLYLLYGSPLKRRARRLITSGPFTYTRHPMYTALAMVDITLWPYAAFDTAFYITGIAFYACMLAAAWCQERETLARFGPEAESYYARTPRLFLLYPFTR
jgi:protein-S-isoprenylcysteine O-methyltransferase Ste14